MVILVTGGSGFIGSHALRDLIDRGEDVVSFSRHQPPTDVASVAKVETGRKGNVTNLTAILDTIKKYSVNCIIHTASLLTSDAQQNPTIAFDVNARGTLNILEASRIMDVRRVIYISGSSVYGSTKKGKKVTEEQPLNPVTIYGAIKVLSERLGLSYVANYGIEWVAIRYPLVYGPGRERGFNYIRDCVEDAVFKGHVTIPRGGDQKYAPVYITDAVNGLIKATFKSKLKYRAFNVGPEPNKMYTLHELANIVKQFFPRAKFEIGPGEIIEEPIRGPLDITRARAELSYKPMYPLLEDGVKEYIKNLTKNF